jgi:hypothetical protein
MSETLATANLNERIYDELRMRVLTRQEPAGRKLSLHMLAPSSESHAVPFITRSRGSSPRACSPCDLVAATSSRR